MDSTHIAWKKPVALALALGILAQPVQSGLRLTSAGQRDSAHLGCQRARYGEQRGAVFGRP